MSDLQTKLNDTLEVFQDLQNLYYYKEDTRGVLKKMYENTLEVLNNPDIDITQLYDEKGNNLLHLAAESYSVDFFIKVAHKGLNPYLQNEKKRNAFQSRHYDFANNLWKKFEHVYFDTQIKDKSFANLTNGFHPAFKQSIYESNIKSNTAQYSMKEISQFLKDNDIYSHANVLLFAFNKFNNPLLDLLEFVVLHQNQFTPEDNSLALHCGLKHMLFKNSTLESAYMFELFINEVPFAINENFLQSMQISADNYDITNFKNIFHKQTEILVDSKYNLKKKFNFYFQCPYKKDNKDINSLNNLLELYRLYQLEPVFNYYKIENKLIPKNSDSKVKNLKI